MAGGRPTVEIVIRRALMPRPSASVAAVERGQHVVEIRQRLAHAHHHDVAEPLLGGEQLLEAEHLLDDLAAGEIADYAVESAGAECATHAAADLRADADRAMPAVVAQQHALDALGVVQFEQQLLGAVVGLAVRGDVGGPEGELFGQLPAERLGQVGHLLEAAGPPLEHPLPHLARRKAGRPRSVNQARSCSGVCERRWMDVVIGSFYHNAGPDSSIGFVCHGRLGRAWDFRVERASRPNTAETAVAHG